MTTLNGVLRSYSAAVRRAEKAHQRHNRETAKRFKLQQKMGAVQSAGQAVVDWQSYVDVLKTMHLNHSDLIHWDEIIKIPAPIEPNKETTNEEIARQQIDAYRPSFVDKIFGLTARKQAKLNQTLEQAKAVDHVEFKLKLREFSEDTENWNRLQKIANGVVNKDTRAYKDALDYFKPFEDLVELAKQLKFKLNENFIDVEIEILSYDIIPGFELNLTSTGKLSRKEMSISKYNELLQQHICSAVIRVAKELSIYFPVNFFIITVNVNELNVATGHRADNTILSTLMSPKKIENINLKNINPVECVKSFVHNMKFSKSTGFNNVPKIDSENNLLSA